MAESDFVASPIDTIPEEIARAHPVNPRGRIFQPIRECQKHREMRPNLRWRRIPEASTHSFSDNYI
jgi:hypothetical protein